MRDDRGAPRDDWDAPALFPGVGPDDPLKRETARSGGFAIDAMMATILAPVKASRIFFPISPDGAIGVWRGEDASAVNLWSHIDDLGNDADYIEQSTHLGGGGVALTQQIPTAIPAGASIVMDFRVFMVVTNLATSISQFVVSIGGVGAWTFDLLASPNQWVQFTRAFTPAERTTLFPGNASGGTAALQMSMSCFLAGDGYGRISGVRMRVT